MSRLIDAWKLCEYANNLKDKQVDANDIMRFPTVDAEPIKHGHWVDDGQRFGNDNECAIYECDQCGETIWVYLKDHRRWNYCPQCGSKMSEEVCIKLKRKDEEE